MRHKKDTCKLGRSTSHRRCLTANMLKSLIHSGGIKTTLAKAKVLRRYADKMITLAKKNTLAARRQAIAEMMISFNSLSDKEERAARNGDKSAYNIDRQVIDQLFGTLGPRFANRQGGYTRILKTENRRGDNAPTCYIEYLAD